MGKSGVAEKLGSWTVADPISLHAALEHHRAGRLPQAQALYRQILQAAPDHADALHYLGAIASHDGRHRDAAELISRAIRIHPSRAMHYNLGNALKALGDLGGAAESYRKALALKPDYAEAHVNLGNALKEQGKLEEAIGHYRKATQSDPNMVGAHANLGNALNELGRPAEAVASYLRALRLRATPESEIGFAQSVTRLRFHQEIAGARACLIRAITEPWGRPGDFVSPVVSLVALDPDIKECMERAASAWPARISGPDLFGADGLAALAGDRLLQCLLENAPVSDQGMERLLTLARFALLETAEATASGDPEEIALPFYCALARQSFITEYVFAYTGEEIERAKLLLRRLVTAVEAGAPFPALWLAAVAAYFPIFSLPSAEALLDRSWPEPVAALLAQQVREPLEDILFRSGIPALTAIEDEVSLLVQRQYEENPYPRWVKMPSGDNAACTDHFAQVQALGKGDGLDILVAGCGTGQHSILVAQQFPGARVLAVDLSLTSLGYAKRKTLELGLTNIEYAQADIMRLAGIGRTFDVIESAGVLHHLADPLAGWKVLLSLLRPGGLMRLGLYSELARQHIVAARRFIAERGHAPSAEGIRQCRQELMASVNDALLGRLTSSRDFFGTSSYRDLIFNVQEHRYTLSQLKENLAELGLNFIGFSVEPSLLSQYKRRFPDDLSQTNLDCWDIFEHENPNMFFGMYQFWVQKRG
ncbi:MAG: tetratricopeptide repeat protein [Nitrosomonadales bacterium]|nr:tetratricopeptide repeat protein [Nitrosomonadales bacterium]